MSFWKEVQTEVQELPKSMSESTEFLRYPLVGGVIGGVLGAIYGNPIYPADTWVDVVGGAGLGVVGGLTVFVFLWASYFQGKKDQIEEIKENNIFIDRP